ncbi:DUF1707 and DUF4190 domain-containing protein [Dactylosporangium fulvum]|uniref:DUF1707 and DUF4190 domain-containing protein n=1 Tax=Dactylosporangium fulvum TaxID=53359 RepID=A0ABY5VVN7_9ACTN|nr:DUF1707 and DUF4190 domain-containing protein [Dactylosporangium fulvum]UWP80548.1 DUF1707 and DUF4190 domain-containing protein [Dactylosporangium fulvum]
MNERVGNAQRTHVLDLLGKAVQEGYLDLSEFDQRMNIVTSAKTAHELLGQLSDLPPRFHWDPRSLPLPPSAPMTAPHPNARTTTVASLVLAIASIPLAVCYGMGGLFGIAAVVLSIPGLRSANERGKAMTGLVLGCLGIVASIAMFFLLMFTQTTPTTR